MMFKVIIAGSRGFNDYSMLRDKCDRILSSISSEIVVISGTAKGADRLGERYAQERGYYLLECPAQWSDVEGKPRNEISVDSNGRPYWNRAGHARNEQMAQEADALILFNLGTPGSNNMLELAQKYKLKIREVGSTPRNFK